MAKYDTAGHAGVPFSWDQHRTSCVSDTKYIQIYQISLLVSVGELSFLELEHRSHVSFMNSYVQPKRTFDYVKIAVSTDRNARPYIMLAVQLMSALDFIVFNNYFPLLTSTLSSV